MRYMLAVAVLMALSGCNQQLPEANQAPPEAVDKIETLSLDQAKALARHPGGLPPFDGLTTLSDEAAKALRAHGRVRF